jgi:hypothetical protein
MYSGLSNLSCHKKHSRWFISLIFIVSWLIVYSGGNSSCRRTIFKIQKRIVRVITNSQNRDSCWGLFKKLNILSLQSQYIFSLLLFVINSRDLYKSNFEIHGINTRYNTYLHPVNQVWHSKKELSILE